MTSKCSPTNDWNTHRTCTLVRGRTQGAGCRGQEEAGWSCCVTSSHQISPLRSLRHGHRAPLPLRPYTETTKWSPYAVACQAELPHATTDYSTCGSRLLLNGSVLKCRYPIEQFALKGSLLEVFEELLTSLL